MAKEIYCQTWCCVKILCCVEMLICCCKGKILPCCGGELFVCVVAEKYSQRYCVEMLSVLQKQVKMVNYKQLVNNLLIPSLTQASSVSSGTNLQEYLRILLNFHRGPLAPAHYKISCNVGKWKCIQFFCKLCHMWRDDLLQLKVLILNHLPR